MSLHPECFVPFILQPSLDRPVKVQGSTVPSAVQAGAG